MCTLNRTEIGQDYLICYQDGEAYKMRRVGTDARGEATFKHLFEGKVVGRASAIAEFNLLTVLDGLKAQEYESLKFAIAKNRHCDNWAFTLTGKYFVDIKVSLECDLIVKLGADIAILHYDHNQEDSRVIKFNEALEFILNF